LLEAIPIDGKVNIREPIKDVRRSAQPGALAVAAEQGADTAARKEA